MIINHAEPHNPHSYLGLHALTEGLQVIRLWRPGAERIHLEVLGQIVEANKVHEAGLFQVIVSASLTYKDYRIYHTSGLLAHDPYSFLPTFGAVDEYLFANGVHYKLYEVMGARVAAQQGVKGVKFAVWAPDAHIVCLAGDFNYWNGYMNPMRMMGSSGVWELFVPGLKEGEKYKFEVKTRSGELLVKADPFALASELRPHTASVVTSTENFHFSDEEWIYYRGLNRGKSLPMTVYEVHLGSWKRANGGFKNYREIAQELAAYCKEMGFTHVELMPIAEHPLDESWGYQVSGFYAVTSRYGSLEDFQYFVNTLHNQGIGVIVDWVPAHFPADDFSLRTFDGTCLYEHADPRQGFHPHWNTCIFNYGRKEVSNFLIANALFWFDKMHIDGLRVDAVASMLYLDYGRGEGEWIPNKYGGKENLEAIQFLKHFNSIVHERFPGVLTIAEESTSFTGVSHTLLQGGLGFDFKWNMGWMNDTLVYFHKDPIFRHYHHNMLTFGLIYAFSEHFILVLSHDEVVHGKGSLIAKMPGDYWQKFANTRLLYSYMICQPGKKLLFMSGELGQWNEWDCKAEIEWALLQFPIHSGLQRCIKELNHFYLMHAQLWQNDFDCSCFEWVDFFDHRNSVISYKRGNLFCIHNFTPTFHEHYFVPLKGAKVLREVFNTDEERFGGSGKVQRPWGYEEGGIYLSLAPLATQIFEIDYA